MARPPYVSIDEYKAIFGDSDENSGDVDGSDSDIDFEGIEEDAEESDGDNNQTGNERASDSDEELEEECWTADLRDIDVNTFNGTGISIDVGHDPKADNFFTFIFGEDLFEKILMETNRYARQKLADNEQRLGRWRDVNKDKIKAYLGVCVIMGINNLPKLADDWSSDIFIGNNGIKQTMTKNRFEEIKQFFHLNNSGEEPARGEENFDRLYKCRPALTSILRNAQRCYSPKKTISINEGMIAFKERLFRRYLPAKPTKYGTKVWMAADASNGYVVNFCLPSKRRAKQANSRPRI